MDFCIAVLLMNPGIFRDKRLKMEKYKEWKEREMELIKEKIERKKWVNTNIQRDRMQPYSLK